MNNYNTNICHKIAEFIKVQLERIEASTEDTTIQLKKYNIIDTNNFDINYLMVHWMTGSITLKCTFEVNHKGHITEFDQDLEIPKMIQNVFVIEGSLRIPTNTLDNDNRVTVYESNIRINDLINVSYEEVNEGEYDIELSIYEDEEPIVIKGTESNVERYKDKLKLSKEEINKIKVKLDQDYVNEYLDLDTIIKLIKRGPDKVHDSIIDKKIYTAEENLMIYLRSRDVRRKILTNMKSKFYQYNTIFLKDIQNAINHYYKVADNKNISFPTTVNPLVFDSMKSKIIIPENVAFNESMTDIIDVVKTPINNHTNYVNELNVCTKVKEDGVYIRCYTYPDQTPIELEYTEYCTKRVVVNQYWDYTNKRFLNPDKEIQYKLRLKYRTGSVKDSYDLIEPKADDKLSLASRRIPLGNMCDSVRLNMNSAMQEQAVELDKSEPALVSAGHDSEDFDKSILTTKYQGGPATVEKIKDNKIFLRDQKTKAIQYIEAPNPISGANDSVISFDIAVKEGDTVVSGDTLVIPHMHKNKAFELGTNVNCIYMNYLGYTHEDGVVISETLSKRMAHYSVINVHIILYPEDLVRYIKPIGSKITSKDILVNNQTKLKVNQNLKDVYTGTGLLAGMGISYNQNNLITPNNTDEGYILDCKIHIEPGRELTNGESNNIIETYKASSKSSDYDFLPDKYKDLKADEIIDLRDNQSGYISLKILRVDNVKVGDKTTNRYGSKGIISLILPDECMPTIIRPDGTKTPAEMLLTPSSVLHRKNISQLYECALTKCIKAIYKKVTDYISDGDIRSCRELLDKFELVYGNRFKNMTDEEFIKYHNLKGLFAYQMEVGFFSKVSYEQTLEWMKMLNISETDKVFCPDVVIVETEDGVRGFSPESFKSYKGKGTYKLYELGELESECVAGTEYIMKLWKQASYDGKVTSELLESTEPIMGRGKYRFEGQKIGEMELWILIGNGIEKFLHDQSDTLRTSQYQFLNELLLSGYYIEDNQGNPLLSDTRTKQKALESL